MLDYISTLPDIVVILIFATVNVASMFLSHRLLRPLVKKYIPVDATHDLIKTVHQALIALAAAMIAFSMVQALDNYKTARNTVLTEINQISDIDTRLARYGTHEANQYRADLLLYTQAIVREDWPLLAKGKGSDVTEGLLVPVINNLARLTPANASDSSMHAQVLKGLDSLDSARDARIQSSKAKIPSLFWTAFFLLFITVNLVTAAYPRSNEKTFALTLHSAIIAALVAIIFIFDHPFSGSTWISPEAVNELIVEMQERTSIHRQ